MEVSDQHHAPATFTREGTPVNTEQDAGLAPETVRTS